MVGSEKGWEYLNSDDVNKVVDIGDDNGSWGYKDVDGSGAYYGADGSWGYRDVGGSGTYYGADGSFGYWDEKGNDPFYISNDSSTNLEADDESYSAGDITVALAGLALAVGISACANRNSHEEEEEEQSKVRNLETVRINTEKKEIHKKKRKIRSIRIKAFLFNKKKLQIDFSTSDLVGKPVDSIFAKLQEAGFSHCKTISINDIYTENINQLNEVEKAVIGGQSWVNIGTMIPYDTEIIITYHAKKKFMIPYSPHQMVKRNYQNVINELSDIGFTEIRTKEINDLKVGWLKTNGSIQQVLINETTDYKKGKLFDYDVSIVVEYHAFVRK